MDNGQLFAARGYAFLAPDLPIDRQTAMADLPKLVMPAVDRLVEMGIADPDRVGVMGHSYGGYSVLCLITQTDRFKAAIVSAGYASTRGHYGEMSRDGSSYGVALSEMQYHGTPWEQPRRYDDNSPLYLLDRVKTPVLLLHGGQDQEVPSFLADEVFVGLRRLGRTVEYALYPDEGHIPKRPQNQVDYLKRSVEWMGQFLGGPKPE